MTRRAWTLSFLSLLLLRVAPPLISAPPSQLRAAEPDLLPAFSLQSVTFRVIQETLRDQNPSEVKSLSIPIGSSGASEWNLEAMAFQAEGFAISADQLFHPQGLEGKRSAVVYKIRTIGPEEVPADEELRREVALSPSNNTVREQIIQQLFEQGGAKKSEIRLQEIGRGYHNIFVVKPGSTDRIIVVGGHHDKVFVGQGTIDNWTGASLVTNLYQALRDIPTRHTFIFMTFGREEEGLVGSRFYVRNLPQQTLQKIDGMLNLDTLGVDGTYSWQNKSDRPLLDLIKEVAQAERLDLKETFFVGGDSDSSSFRRAGVQAMTVFGCSPEKIFQIIHSERDTIAYFSLPHYKSTFLLSAAFLKALDDKTAGSGLQVVAQGFSPAMVGSGYGAGR